MTTSQGYCVDKNVRFFFVRFFTKWEIHKENFFKSHRFNSWELPIRINSYSQIVHRQHIHRPVSPCHNQFITPYYPWTKLIYLVWPGLDSDISVWVSHCESAFRGMILDFGPMPGPSGLTTPYWSSYHQLVNQWDPEFVQKCSKSEKILKNLKREFRDDQKNLTF